jgi:Branched-chain amino acid ABC-type transport system, permease components
MSAAPILLLNALVATLVLALAAVGLAIVFGLLGVINLAHGAFIALGAYTAWFGAQAGHFWLGFLAAPVVVGAVGYALEITVVRRLYGRPLDTILATWGIALVVQETLKIAFGVTTKRVPLPVTGGVDLGVVVYPTYRLLLVVMATVVLGTVLAVLVYTDFGVRLRAAVQDAETASLLGLDRRRLYSLGFASGAALAGLAGAALAPIATVAPEMGVEYLVESFFAVIVGGTAGGVVLGSAVVAGTASLLEFSLPPVLAQTLVFVAAVLVVAVRPEGIVRR